jgi:hypothetical protein
MYTLRRVTKDGIQMNFALGNFYSLIMKDSPHFKRESESIPIDNIDDVTSLVQSSDPKELPFVIYKKHDNYIMTESGQTLSKL